MVMTIVRNSYGVIQKDFKGITTFFVTDNAEMAIHRADICRNWNRVCDKIDGKMKDCIVFYHGKYDIEKDKLTLYKNGYIVDEFHEVL